MALQQICARRQWVKFAKVLLYLFISYDFETKGLGVGSICAMGINGGVNESFIFFYEKKLNLLEENRILWSALFFILIQFHNLRVC